MTRRKTIAVASAALLWLALHAIVALPFILDPLAIMKILPIYLGGALLLFEPLACFWAGYQYRYMLRAEPNSLHQGDSTARGWRRAGDSSEPDSKP
jgi:hypothetical protein